MINLADEKAEEVAEDVVVMEFKPKDIPEEDIEVEKRRRDISQDTSKKTPEESSESDSDSSQRRIENVPSTLNEETDTSVVDRE